MSTGCVEPKKYGSESGRYTLNHLSKSTSVLLDTETGEMRVLDINRQLVFVWGSVTVEQLDSLSRLDQPFIKFEE